MNRHDDWQNRLSNLIRERQNTPFEFGTFDCTLWAMEGIKAVIDIDYSGPYAGNYNSAKGALKILQKVGNVKQPIELIDNYLGERKPIAFARKGDIVAVDAGKAGLSVPSSIDVFGPVLGVCYGDISFFVGEHGLISWPTIELGSAHHVIFNQSS
jgi:hypothetical protein